MSYSYSFEGGHGAPLEVKVDEKIDTIQSDTAGHREASSHRNIVIAALQGLASGLHLGDGEFSGSVSGHGGDGYTSISLSVQAYEAPAQEDAPDEPPADSASEQVPQEGNAGPNPNLPTPPVEEPTEPEAEGAAEVVTPEEVSEPANA